MFRTKTLLDLEPLCSMQILQFETPAFQSLLWVSAGEVSAEVKFHEYSVLRTQVCN